MYYIYCRMINSQFNLIYLNFLEKLIYLFYKVHLNINFSWIDCIIINFILLIKY